MPLRPRAKVPALNAWSQYAAQLPTEAQQAHWLEAYADGNIGMPLGPQSGIIAFDIDSIDERLDAVLERVLPKSPWRRVGKKGCVFAYRYSGERTFRIKDENNNTIVELLSKGAQVVLPPSIHPDTGAPYEANCELIEVVDALPSLPADFEEQLRQALIAAGFKLASRGVAKVSEWVPAGGRDSAMVGVAGIMARAVIRGERTLLEALHEMEVWANTFTEKVAGDPLDPEKAKQKVIQFVKQDLIAGRKLPHDWSLNMTPEEHLRFKEMFGLDAIDWGLGQYVEEIMTIQALPDLADRVARVDELLQRIARSQHLGDVEESTILKQIQRLGALDVQYSTLKNRVRELRKGELLGDNHAEIAKALKDELERNGVLKFANGQFWQWAGSHWKELKEHVIRDTVATEFGGLAGARKFSDVKGIVGMLKDRVTAPLKLDETPGVNFANGYLTTDMQLVDHDPRYGTTYVLPYRYIEDARLPLKFLGLLDRCWGKEADYADRVQALREAIASTLFGVATRYSRAFALIGLPHTGKSTVIETVCGLMPDEAICTIAPEKWAERFEPVHMVGKALNFAGELSEDKTISGKMFKLIVEGASIQAERKGLEGFSFRPTCAHWFGGNFMPKTRDTSGGFTRRWLFLDFNDPMPYGDRTVKYHEMILSEEREDIVAWALPAIRDLMGREDYLLPACHYKREQEMAAAVNSALAFIETSHVTIAPGVGCKLQSVYDAYYSYVRMEARAQPYAIKRFQHVLGELGAKMGFMVTNDAVEGLTLTRLLKLKAVA